MAELRKQMMQQALVIKSDIIGDMQTEIVDTVIGCIDKYGCTEMSAMTIKDNLDKLYGPTWQVVIGKGFAFDITSLDNTLMHCYYQGDTGILLYKS